MWIRSTIGGTGKYYILRMSLTPNKYSQVFPDAGPLRASRPGHSAAAAYMGLLMEQCEADPAKV